jgi:cGMP-dependent protein kinase
MNSGDSFGEQALFKNSIRGATVIADDDTVICLALGRDKLNEILGDNLQSIIFNNLIKWALEKHNYLHNLT